MFLDNVGGKIYPFLDKNRNLFTWKNITFEKRGWQILLICHRFVQVEFNYGHRSGGNSDNKTRQLNDKILLAKFGFINWLQLGLSTVAPEFLNIIVYHFFLHLVSLCDCSWGFLIFFVLLFFDSLFSWILRICF